MENRIAGCATRTLGTVLLSLPALCMAGSGHARTETFRWSDPNPAPSSVVGFRVHVGPSSRDYTTVVDVGLPPADANGVRSASTVVPDAATVYVALTAYDAESQESDFSNEKVRPPDVSEPANAPPESTIDAPAGPVTITTGETVFFAGSGADPDGDLPLAYRWDFDAAHSGVPSSAAENPGPVEFLQPGTFAVRFTVTDAFGMADPTPASVTVIVEPVSVPAPDSRIDEPAGSVTITAGESVVFAGSAVGGAPPLSYRWTFDGPSGVQISTAEDPGAVGFPQVGTYSVRLDVTDSGGRIDSTPATITVTAEPPALPPGGGLVGNNFPPAAIDVDIQWVATGLDTPVYLTAPRADPRLFVVEAGGAIRIVADWSVLPEPFLDLSFDVSSSEEGGLLGLAFDPAYSENGLFYVHRTDLRGDSVLSRFRVSADPNVADAGSEEVILWVAQPFPEQNGGSIVFGPEDGFLYLGLGDGGSVDDPGNRAQDGGELLGKLLRLDVSVPHAPDSLPTGAGYAIPADNPFVGDPDVRDEIWALGLRNPYRFSFDRDLFDLWLADEGQDAREEVNFEAMGDAGGHNYGWDVTEGSLCNVHDPAPAPPCDDPSLVPPLHEYPHTGGNCAITGGYVYRGTTVELQGQYFFADYCSGGVWSLDRASGEGTDWTSALGAAAGLPFELVSFGEGGAGDLYILHRSGDIFRLGLPNAACSDGLDNDGDGFIDFPEDPGCRNADGSREDPACDDQLDNDGDGPIDVFDAECTVAWWNDEAASGPDPSQAPWGACGLGFELVFVLPPLIWLRGRRRRRRG